MNLQIHPDADTGAIYAIVNQSSGTGEGSDCASRLEKALATTGRPLEVHTVAPGDNLTEIARTAVRNGFSTVVAAGGDGTICGVAAGLVDSGVKLGILPLGTFNFFARSFDVPVEFDEAVEIIRSGRTTPATLGEINGRVFINNASIGAYAMILKEREDVYKTWGRSRIAAYWSVVKAMITLYKPMTMAVSVDGKKVRAKSPMVFVGICAYQLEYYELEGAEAVRDGKFAVMIAPDSGRLMLIWRALKIALRGARRERDFTLLTGEEVVIETRRAERLVARDGENERMKGPYHFRVLKDAVQVLVPAE